MIKEEERERLKNTIFGQNQLSDLHYIRDSTSNNLKDHLIKYASQSYRDFIFNTFTAPFYQNDPKKRDIFNYTLLHWCIELNQMDLVKKLIQEKVYGVDQFIDLNTNPLILSACVGNLKLVNFLLNLDADMNAAGQDIYSALHLAINNGHTLIVKRLLECKTINLGKDSLVDAAMGGFIDIVTLLLDKDELDISSATYPGETALYLAAVQGHVDVVKLLLHNGALVKDCVNSVGYTLLMSLVKKDEDTPKNIDEILSIILDYCREDDVLAAFPGRPWGNEKDEPNIGDTALHIAAAQGNIEAYKLLSTSFPKLVSMRNSQEQTALELVPDKLKSLFLEACTQQNSIKIC